MDRQQQIQEDAKEVVTKLERLVNCFDDEAVAKAFVESMRSTHLTLQQSMMRVFMAQIKAWSETSWVDLRNQATVDLCKEIMEKVGNDSFLPFI
jgi:hypothetical protein